MPNNLRRPQFDDSPVMIPGGFTAPPRFTFGRGLRNMPTMNSVRMNGMPTPEDEEFDREIQKERAERERLEAIPHRVVMEKVEANGVITYNICVYREKTLMERHGERNKNRALQVYNSMVRDYQNLATNNEWRKNEKYLKPKDLRGQELSRTLRNNVRRNRVDRRARRPEEDVITEDGLVINLNPEELDKKTVSTETKVDYATALYELINDLPFPPLEFPELDAGLEVDTF